MTLYSSSSRLCFALVFLMGCSGSHILEPGAHEIVDEGEALVCNVGHGNVTHWIYLPIDSGCAVFPVGSSPGSASGDEGTIDDVVQWHSDGPYSVQSNTVVLSDSDCMNLLVRVTEERHWPPSGTESGEFVAADIGLAGGGEDTPFEMVIGGSLTFEHGGELRRIELREQTLRPGSWCF